MLYYFLLEWKASIMYDDVIIATQKTFEEAVIIINKFREYNFECIIMHDKYTFFRSFLPKDFIRHIPNQIKNKSKKRNYMIMKDEENDKIKNYEESFECFSKTLKIRKKTLGAHHIKTEGAYNNVAIALDKMNKLVDSLENCKK
jgi:hypothetical protein